MRPVLRLLRTRYGTATALLAVLTLVVLAFRGTTGARHEPRSAPNLESPRPVSVEPRGLDGVVDEPSEPASTREAASSGAVPTVEAAKTLAEALARAWCNHTGVTGEQWRAGLASYVSAALAGRLSEADPSRVPADTVAGEARLVIRDPALIEASIALNSGTLHVVLIVVKDAWRADGLTWDRPT